MRRASLVTCAILLALAAPRIARTQEAPVTPPPPAEDTSFVDAGPEVAGFTGRAARPARPALEPLVPEVAAHPYRLDPGVRPYLHRVSVSPAWGWFGDDRLYTLRAAYNPEPWLGYEAALGHNPGRAVHAVLHTLSAVVRRPVGGRLQPYATAGYGMIIVFPGQAVNASPVTKNCLTVGGGLEAYIRSDLAVRAELRHASVFGEQRNRQGIVVYPYSQGTIGLSFYRSVQP